MPNAASIKGGRRSTSALLRTAYRILGQLTDLLHAAERIEALPDEAPPPGIKDITPRELEILRLMAGPNDDKNYIMYTQLGISKRTFDQHVSSLYKKLGVRKNTGAVRVAVKWGLV